MKQMTTSAIGVSLCLCAADVSRLHEFDSSILCIDAVIR